MDYLTPREIDKLFLFLKEHCKCSKSRFGRKIGRKYISINRSINNGTFKRKDARKFFKEIDFVFKDKND